MAAKSGGVSHANRGKGLEIAILQANNAYWSAGIALVQKVATPTKVLPDRRSGQSKVIRERSTVDFLGTWGGRPIAFDAKENRETSFPFKNIHEHQLQFLAGWEAAGGIGFLLINQVSDQAVYLLPLKILEPLWYAWSLMLGRASIPIEDLRRLPRCRPGRGCTIDYLAALDEWLRKGETPHVPHIQTAQR